MTRTKINFVALIILALTLSSCNLPDRGQVENTPTADVVATEVALMLTEMPTDTSVPTQTPQPDQPTAAPTNTIVDTPTSPPEATSTPIPGDPAVALGVPGWTDNLDTMRNFYLYENDNTAFEDGSGSLRMVGRTAVGWQGWSLTYSQNGADFYLEGEFKTGSCSGSDVYGLVFRASKENTGYFYEITCDGRYGLRARDFNNNENEEILALKSNSAILGGSGQVNRIGIKTDGSKIALYANGALMEEVTDDTYESGYFGVFIAGVNTAGFTVDLDRISFWKLD